LSHVEELERRVLEYGMKLGINDPLAEPLPTDQPRKQTKKRNPKPPQEESADQPSSSTAEAPHDPGTIESVVPEGIDETHTETSSEDFPVMDGMVSYARSPPQQGRPTSFFGPSSTFNFVMKMKTANDVSPTGTHAHTSPSAHPSRKRPRDEMEHDDDERARKFLTTAHHEFFALPQRHVAKFLLDKYFTAVHPVWPFLIESETRTHFDQTWSSDSPQSSMWLAILNLIFALGCQFCEDAQQGNMAEVPIENPLQAGAEFYHRARGFVLTNLFDSGSIECVQALLLMAQYQQGTMRPNQCWLTVGHATRMSQGIGLHLDTSELKISPLERELGKRLWWGCFCLDRYHPLPLGLPDVQGDEYDLWTTCGHSPGSSARMRLPAGNRRQVSSAK
jgi:Fungal specific transcription factor domain